MMNRSVERDERILIDETQAAQKLGLSAKTLFNMRKAGQIPFVRARGRILYRVAALEKWAEEQEQIGVTQ